MYMDAHYYLIKWSKVLEKLIDIDFSDIYLHNSVTDDGFLDCDFEHPLEPDWIEHIAVPESIEEWNRSRVFINIFDCLRLNLPEDVHDDFIFFMDCTLSYGDNVYFEDITDEYYKHIRHKIISPIMIEEGLITWQKHDYLAEMEKASQISEMEYDKLIRDFEQFKSYILDWVDLLEKAHQRKGWGMLIYWG